MERSLLSELKPRRMMMLGRAEAAVAADADNGNDSDQNNDKIFFMGLVCF